MSGKSRFSLDEKDAILAAYEAGEKVEVIALLHDCAMSFPAKLAARKGIALRRSFKRRARLTDGARGQIVDAWVAGESGTSIAARFGCDPTYPGLLARRLGRSRIDAVAA